MSADTERCVKYMANSPAKNMSSLDSQTMVPTETEFGRLTFTWGALGAAVVDDTQAIMARDRGVLTTPPVRDSSGPPPPTVDLPHDLAAEPLVPDGTRANTPTGAVPDSPCSSPGRGARVGPRRDYHAV